MSCLRLDLFGGMSVALDGQPCPSLNNTRTGLLLVRVALEQGDQIARSLLAAMLWPDLSPAAARSNLRQHLFQINRQLGARNGDFIDATPEHVRFNHAADVVVDVQRLLEARDDPASIGEALACYRGPFLAGIDDRIPSGEILQWVLDRRGYYWRQAVDRLDRMTRALRDTGHGSQALPHIERFLQLDPLDETLHRLKLATLLDDGLADAARRQYDQCRDILEAELGVAPGEATEALRATAEDMLSGSQPIPEDQACLPQEERPVTIVCCQLELVHDADLETATCAIEDHAERATTELRAWRGHVIPVHGSALLAYFGYPAADEEASVHAVGAALAVVSTLNGNNTGVSARALVHSDRIVTGKDPEMPDPAGRLSGQALALVGEVERSRVAITDSVRTRVDGFFGLTRMDVPARKGDDHQHMLWRVSHDGRVRDRIEARRARGTFRVLGRTHEWQALQRHWQQCRQGRAGAVLVRGEPGIGKSHLLRGFAREVRAREGNRVLLLRGRRETRHAMAEPIRRGLIHAFDLAAEGEVASHEQARVALRAASRLPDETITTLADLASARSSGYTGMEQEPARRREALIEALLALTADSIDGNELLLICDDVQWMDSVTLEFLRRVVQRLPTTPILILLAARPEFEAPWPDLDVDPLTLGPLGADTTQEIAASMDRNQRLSAREHAELAACSEGVPLFVEELTRYRLEVGSRASEDLGNTLEEFLLARLERLGPVREIAQCAAVIGRSFDREALARLTGSSLPALDEGLEQLQRQGLIHPLTGADAGCYRFSHALFQRAAYDCQLRSRRRSIHASLCTVLQERERGGQPVPPAQIARHLAASDQRVAASQYYLQAGNDALTAAMHHEAAEHYASARGLLDDQSDARERVIEALVGEGSARVAIEGYGAASVYPLFTEAARLASTDTPDPLRFRILWGLCLGAGSWTDFIEARRLAGDMHRIAINTDDRRLGIAALYAQSNTHYWTGDFAAALDYGRQAAALHRPEDHDFLVTTFGEDCGCSAKAYVCLALWQIGQAQRAREEMDALRVHVDRTCHPATRTYVYTFAAYLGHFMDDPEWTRSMAATARDIAREMHYPCWLRAANAVDAWARAYTGDASALDEIRATVDAVRETMDGGVTMLVYLQMQGARALGRTGEIESLATEALDRSARTGEQHLRPEILRLRGLARLTAEADAKTAAAGRRDLDTAITEAHAQGAVLMELRARSARLQHAEDATTHSRLAAALTETLRRLGPEACPTTRAARAQADSALPRPI